jgi:redox-sensitive bicupin YhaK (pirin superfamily)
MTSKPVINLHPAMRDDIADLVTRRPVPSRQLNNIGAFLFLNHHGPQTYAPGNRGLPFGPHPHRGFETVTFILEGDLAHRDSGGHESVIHAGGVQWMTAGSGLVHEEVSPEAFKRAGGPMEILQLWVNLPSQLKMTAPRYTGVQQNQIPAIEAEGVTLNLISGEWRGLQGPITSLTGVFMTTLDMKAGGRIVFDGLEGRDVFCYVARGDVAVNGADVSHFNLVEFGEGDLVDIEAVKDSVLLFGHAAPINEPIVAHGPFVMNTVAEIHQAYADYQAGKFG